MKEKQEIQARYCSISGNSMEAVFSAELLNKYNVQYYVCKECGLLQTEQPYWLDEAYTQVIAATDTGILRRNFNHLLRSLPLLDVLAEKNSRLLDVGGGYGILTRMLRDVGYDCYSYDKYCQNLFADGFEPEDNFSARVLFAFEVFEHIEDPMMFIQNNFSKYSCKTMILSTQVYEDTIPDRNWWYYSLETGQHITFYQSRTLKLLAEKNDCFYLSLGNGFHLITNEKVSKMNKIIFSNRVLSAAKAMFLIFKMKTLSKTQADFKKISEKLSHTSSHSV